MITLRPVESINPHDLALQANNPAVARNLRDIFPHPYTIENARHFLGLARQKLVGHVFGIFENETFIGIGSIIPQTDIHRMNAEIGYWIGESYWGKGYGTEAVRQLVRYAFDELKLIRVYASVFESNKASMRVLEKSGFQLEVIIKSGIIKNDVVMDEYLYSILLDNDKLSQNETHQQ
jgi:RimJ/RimL family protein N-acetyltransferase